MVLPLKFDLNGNFKIVQLTDLHEGPNIDKTIDLMNKILKYEKPNLVLLTGDIIDGKCKTVDDIKKAISCVAGPMENRNIPWAIIFGNHDDEHGIMTKEEMMKFYMTFKYNISEIGYKTFDRIGNYNLLVNSSRDATPILNIYMLDSGKYFFPFISTFNWIKCTQIYWYNKTSWTLNRRYNKMIPSLMFIHIPLPEFHNAWSRGLISGERNETECCPKINTGLFAALVKTGDVKGVFSGHDHLNNYYATLNGIRVGYGGCTGYAGYGGDNLKRGARVFLINESNPTDFKTWLRLEVDEELNAV